ncbi:hypothetical protein COS70_00605 [Candidatus Micrarchaeota archaeon CG06_land_8_20_14_3_00_50_6]|nr:MAG: hypothetical protein COS70_00605 [Candidatus Micrarchaeota archaeon CG06_land_8_20_14_3_00_50_6]
MAQGKFLLFGGCVAAFIILIHLSGCAASLNQGTCCAPPSPTFSGSFSCDTKLSAHDITASCSYDPKNPPANFCTISESECRSKVCAKPDGSACPPCATTPCPLGSDSCNNCVDNCVNNIKIPVCTPTSDPFCSMPYCTAMICGIPAAAGGNYQPMQELLSENPDFEPNVGAPVGYRDSPENLYMSRCEFSPMDAKTYNQLNKLGGSAYVNSFRFGMGTSFSDFEETRQYLPKTDQVCALNPNGYTDRFTNYLGDAAGVPYMLDPTTINPFVCEYDPVYVSEVINVYVDGVADFSLDFAAAGGPVCIFLAPDDSSADYAAGATLYNTRNEPIAYCTFIGGQGVKPLVAMPGKTIASAQHIKCTRMDSINDNGIQDSLLESCAINEVNGFKVPQIVLDDSSIGGKHSYWFRTYATTAAQPVMREFTTASYQVPWYGGIYSTEVSQINYKYYGEQLKEAYAAQRNAGYCRSQSGASGLTAFTPNLALEPGNCPDGTAWQQGAPYECRSGGACLSGNCDKLTYNESRCVLKNTIVPGAEGEAEYYKEAECGCFYNNRRKKVCAFAGDAGVPAIVEMTDVLPTPLNPITITVQGTVDEAIQPFIANCGLTKPDDYELTTSGGGYQPITTTIKLKSLRNCALDSDVTDSGTKELALNDYGWCQPCTTATLAVQRVSERPEYLIPAQAFDYPQHCPTTIIDATTGAKLGEVCVDAFLTAKTGVLTGPHAYYICDCSGIGFEANIAGSRGQVKDKINPGVYPQFNPGAGPFFDLTSSYLKQNVIPIIVVDPAMPFSTDPVKDPFAHADLFGLGLFKDWLKDRGPMILVLDEARYEPGVGLTHEQPTDAAGQGPETAQVPLTMGYLSTKLSVYREACPNCLLALKFTGDDSLGKSQYDRLINIFSSSADDGSGIAPVSLMNAVDLIALDYDYTTTAINSEYKLETQFDAIVGAKLGAINKILAKLGKPTVIDNASGEMPAIASSGPPQNILVYTTSDGSGADAVYIINRFNPPPPTASIKSVLEAQGHTVTMKGLNHEGYGSITDEFLAPYDQVWILSTEYGGFNLQQDELVALNNFHNLGKGIFITGDHADSHGSYDIHVNQILSAFGSATTMGGTRNRGSGCINNVPIPTGAHLVLGGVSAIHADPSEGVISRDANTINIWDDGIAEYNDPNGGGKVIIDASFLNFYSYLSSNYAGMCDNPQYILNIANYIAYSPSTTAGTSWDNPSNHREFYEYIFRHQRNFTDNGAIGIVFKDWGTINAVPQMKCGMEQGSRYALGKTQQTFYLKRFATTEAQGGCECMPCTSIDLQMGKCTPFTLDGSLCSLPSGGLSYYNMKAPDSCVSAENCVPCEFIPSDLKIVCKMTDEYTPQGFVVEYPPAVLARGALYKDVISSLRDPAGNPAQCCLTDPEMALMESSGSGGQKSAKYTYAKKEATKTNPEPVVYSQNGDLVLSCGKPEATYSTSISSDIVREEKAIECTIPTFELSGILVYSGSDEIGGTVYTIPIFSPGIKSVLEPEGYSVTMADRTSASVPILTEEYLDQFSQLWFMSTDYEVPLPQASVDAIKAFHESGRGILIAGDHAGFNTQANQIFAAIGSSTRVDPSYIRDRRCVGTSPSPECQACLANQCAGLSGQALDWCTYSCVSAGAVCIPVSSTAHPILNGVSTTTAYKSEGVIQPDLHTQILFDNGIAEYKGGPGKVLVEASFPKFYGSRIGSNACEIVQYVKNIAEYLKFSTPVANTKTICFDGAGTHETVGTVLGSLNTPAGQAYNSLVGVDLTTADWINGCSVIILEGRNSVLLPEELANLKAFMSRGRGLLVAGSSASAGIYSQIGSDQQMRPQCADPQCTSVANPVVASAFSGGTITLSGSGLGSGYPITGGPGVADDVTSLTSPGSHLQIQADLMFSVVPLATYTIGGNKVMAIQYYTLSGNSRTVFSSGGFAGNAQFSVNSLKWLAKDGT